MRCMRKDRERRFQSIADARIELEELSVAETRPREIATAPGKAPGNARRLGLATWFLAVIAVLAALAFSVRQWRIPREAGQVIQLRLHLEPPPDLGRPQAANVIVAPNGSRVVYRGSVAGSILLYTRALDELQVRPLAGTEGAENPFFSPDSDWIGFFSAGKLKKVAARGGSVIALCDAPNNRGGAWADDGTIIAALSNVGGLSRVSANGTVEKESLTRLLGDEATHRWPQIIPGANAVVFTAHKTVGGGFDDATMEVQSIATGQRSTLVRGGHYGRYSASGHLLFVREGVLRAAPFDARSLKLTSEPSPVLDDVLSSAVLGGAQVDVSRTGTLIYADGVPRRRRIVESDLSGRIHPISADNEFFGAIRMSPDGKRLAVDIIEKGNLDVWVYDRERETNTRLTNTAGTDAWPIWTPDGKSVIFSSARHGGAENLYWMRADGAGEPVRLLQSDVLQAAASISDDGALLFTERQAETGVDVWTVRIEHLHTGTPKAGRPSRIMRTQHPITNPRLSPDGRWLAYQSSESGSPHVYVLGLPDSGKFRISSDAAPASAPRWSRQDNRLFYRTPVGIMVVDYTVSGKTFIPQKSRLHLTHKAIPNSYDLRHDTQGIVFLQSDAPNSEPSNHVVLVLRFFDFLRNRLSTQ